MKRKLRIIVDCGDTFCGKCEHVSTWLNNACDCALFVVPLTVAGDTKPKRHAKCLEAEGLR